MSKPLISCNPDVMGGTPVFAGTRVPVQTLLDYLEAGDSIDDFLEGFPSVTREQVIDFLEQAKDRLVAATSSEQPTLTERFGRALRGFGRRFSKRKAGKKPKGENESKNEERWRRFVWMPGDVVIVKPPGATEAEARQEAGITEKASEDSPTSGIKTPSRSGSRDWADK